MKFNHQLWAYWPSRPILAFCLLCFVWQGVWPLQDVLWLPTRSSQWEVMAGDREERGREKSGNFFCLLCIPGWTICPSLFRALFQHWRSHVSGNPAVLENPGSSVTLSLLQTVSPPGTGSLLWLQLLLEGPSIPCPRDGHCGSSFHWATPAPGLCSTFPSLCPFSFPLLLMSRCFFIPSGCSALPSPVTNSFY